MIKCVLQSGGRNCVINNKEHLIKYLKSKTEKDSIKIVRLHKSFEKDFLEVSKKLKLNIDTSLNESKAESKSNEKPNATPNKGSKLKASVGTKETHSTKGIEKGKHSQLSEYRTLLAKRLSINNTIKNAKAITNEYIAKLSLLEYDSKSIVKEFSKLKRQTISLMNPRNKVSYNKRIKILDKLKIRESHPEIFKTTIAKNSKYLDRLKGKTNRSESKVNATNLYKALTKLLKSNDYKEVLCALGLITGRRGIEIIITGNFDKYNDYALKFSGVAKQDKYYKKAKGITSEQKTYVIPCLWNVDETLMAIKHVRELLSKKIDDKKADFDFHEKINNVISKSCKNELISIQRRFCEQVDKNLSLHDLRSLYACICVQHIRHTNKSVNDFEGAEIYTQELLTQKAVHVTYGHFERVAKDFDVKNITW